jgi:predicted TIM-barrel fold metal-dependent hydrolase
MPHQTGEFVSPEELVRAMDGEGVKAVTLRPKTNIYPLHEDVLAPLASALNPRQMLILTTMDELDHSYESAVRFCRIFRDCPVIIAEASWSDWRTMIAIMDSCPNARLEFHSFQANRAVDAFAERFGVERVLFGSGLLRFSAGGARGFVDWSLMDDEATARFAGGNLAELIGVSKLPAKPSAADPDELVTAARGGLAVPCPVIDAHSHVLHDGLNGAGRHYVMLRGDMANMIELNRRAGIDASAISAWNSIIGMDIEDGSALIEDLVRRYPDYAIGLATCDPTTQSRDEISQLCERFYLKSGFRGMKPYQTNRLSFSHPDYEPFWTFCNDHRLYGLMHTADHIGGIESVCQLAKTYPEATFLIAHTGQSWSYARQVAAAVQSHPNIMAELTYTTVCNGLIEWLCRTIGADRVLFGTDSPMRDPRPQVGWCVYTRLNCDDKKKILGGNFARILKRGNIPGHRLPGIVEDYHL